ncbi:hypothetical protein H0H81_006872 [Sphagnurus paluster]|uniref:Uncharacterized protein n=1 Tax=Sphagnurus paluster TaxID=117069 RepID=A0A9P7GVH9_9AGAR|nr:hypothetical protein H0H81_006872 [Sphagnurus paluster]
MRIPSSSSFILAATLAVSSSTPSLAAPAGESSEGGMTSSSSNHHIASRTGPVTGRAEQQDEVADQSSSTNQEIEGRDLLDILCGLPVVGGAVDPLLVTLGAHCGGFGAESMQAAMAGSDFDAESTEKFASAVGVVSSILASASGLPVVGGVVGAPAAVVTGVAPEPIKDAMRRDEELVADPASSSAPTQTQTDSLYPSATPMELAGTPNNTPNIAAIPDAAGGVFDKVPGPAPGIIVPIAGGLPIPAIAIPVDAAAVPAEDNTTPLVPPTSPDDAPVPPSGSPTPPSGTPSPPDDASPSGPNVASLPVVGGVAPPAPPGAPAPPSGPPSPPSGAPAPPAPPVSPGDAPAPPSGPPGGAPKPPGSG